MPHTRRTLRLDDKKWDLLTDGVGQIEVRSDDIATAQNVSNEARLFTEDAYFIQDQGIPHYAIELGKNSNLSILQAQLRDAALKVPDVAEVLSVNIISFDPKTRVLTGDIVFMTQSGNEQVSRLTYF